MARHRNIRGLKYDEDFEDDDVYGQSVEDDYCISPATAAQFIYKRDDYNSRAFAEEPLEEDDEFEDKVEESSHSNMPLSGVDQVRLYACLDKMREVLGESASEQVMVDAILNCEYDAHKALDLVLSEECKPTPDKKNQITASSRKSTIGDPFHSSKLVVSKHTDSCFPVPLLYDADSSSTFDLSVLLSTKSEQSCVSSALMVAHESINNESANEGDQTLIQSVSLSEIIKETPNLLQTHTRVPNGPFADETTINSQRGINLADLIKDCEGNSQDLNPLISSVLPNVMDCTSLSTDKTELSLSTQNKSEGILQPAPTELLFKVGDTNHIQPTYLTLSSQNPECLVPSLKGLNLIEQLNQHQKKNDGHNDSWDTAGQSSLKDIVEMHGSLSFPQCGSPSLADLIEEHKKGSPSPSDSPSVPQCSSTDSVILPLGSLSLAQLAGESQNKAAGSLSSLMHSKPLNTSELENMSLFDLITENVQVPENSKAQGIHFDTCKKQQAVGKTVWQRSTDSKVVMKNKSLKTTRLENSTQSKKTVNLYKAFNGNVSIRNRKPSRRTRTTSWTKRCCAEPSWFALAICFQNPIKKKKKSLLIHNSFLYSRQVPERMEKDQGLLFEIKPFDFSTPSPDDIVKASQKKVFH
ncbi:HBS1-like protein isoform X2 [Hypanus sabinus]|uniref:HBS1-like protein isoform X2 n=1 Tax=Hypanus sabinus TaxID=79690 RepID=UPI0028C3E46A|nr:HBS1-like protein isoform X2 [Hypanus sabinus]